uniref:BTB domain-containing protein n=1 Tax=Ditylenchus dipsaci TaxID=166011 RepID=A0A915DFT9_9BILA
MGENQILSVENNKRVKLSPSAKIQDSIVSGSTMKFSSKESFKSTSEEIGGFEWYFQANKDPEIPNSMILSIHCKNLAGGYPFAVKFSICLIGSKENWSTEDSRRICHKAPDHRISCTILPSRVFDPAYGFLDGDGNLTARIGISIADASSVENVNLSDGNVSRRSAQFYEDDEGFQNYLDAPSISSYDSDCVLQLDGKPVHVNKAYLSIHSSVFKNMFSEDPSIKEYDIKDVTYEEFNELLNVIYPVRKPISGTNVESLLKLGHHFGMADLLIVCENFLLRNSKLVSLANRLWMAQEYGLNRLLARAVKSFRAISDLKKLGRDEKYPLLTVEMKAMILEHLVGPTAELVR